MTKSHGKTAGRDRIQAATRGDIEEIVDASRRAADRSLNAIMTATYWAVGRRISDAARAGAGDHDGLVEELARDLGARFGRAYSAAKLRRMVAFYRGYADILDAAPGGGRYSSLSSPSGNYLAELSALMAAFPLPWSHYVVLIALPDREVRTFYEAEALRGGWSARQLAHQIDARLHERARPTGTAAAAGRGRPTRPSARDEPTVAGYAAGFAEPAAERGEPAWRVPEAVWAYRPRRAGEAAAVWLQ